MLQHLVDTVQLAVHPFQVFLLPLHPQASVEQLLFCTLSSLDAQSAAHTCSCWPRSRWDDS